MYVFINVIVSDQHDGDWKLKTEIENRTRIWQFFLFKKCCSRVLLEGDAMWETTPKVYGENTKFVLYVKKILIYTQNHKWESRNPQNFHDPFLIHLYIII